MRKICLDHADEVIAQSEFANDLGRRDTIRKSHLKFHDARGPSAIVPYE